MCYIEKYQPEYLLTFGIKPETWMIRMVSFLCTQDQAYIGVPGPDWKSATGCCRYLLAAYQSQSPWSRLSPQCQG